MSAKTRNNPTANTPLTNDANNLLSTSTNEVETSEVTPQELNALPSLSGQIVGSKNFYFSNEYPADYDGKNAVRFFVKAFTSNLIDIGNALNHSTVSQVLAKNFGYSWKFKDTTTSVIYRVILRELRHGLQIAVMVETSAIKEQLTYEKLEAKLLGLKIKWILEGFTPKGKTTKTHKMNAKKGELVSEGESALKFASKYGNFETSGEDSEKITFTNERDFYNNEANNI